MKLKTVIGAATGCAMSFANLYAFQSFIRWDIAWPAQLAGWEMGDRGMLYFFAAVFCGFGAVIGGFLSEDL